jgi:hypothetical protein
VQLHALLHKYINVENLANQDSVSYLQEVKVLLRMLPRQIMFMDKLMIFIIGTAKNTNVKMAKTKRQDMKFQTNTSQSKVIMTLKRI